jgi:hypothetical protein
VGSEDGFSLDLELFRGRRGWAKLNDDAVRARERKEWSASQTELRGKVDARLDEELNTGVLLAVAAFVLETNESKII